MGVKEDESSSGCIWAAEFHHVMACSCLAGVVRLTHHFFKFFSDCSEPWITETVNTESVDTGAHLYSITPHTT
jgi:hypothetical protein